tara:strand:- start:1033 stop:1545 length:513 start_codon:yes stop_codon:yes gene_type:complete
MEIVEAIMIRSKAAGSWGRFAGELVVPVLLLGYATQYYASVASLPRPETNLLLIGPVYWLLFVCCLGFAMQRLVETLRSAKQDLPATEAEGTRFSLFKSLGFLVLTAGCIWAIGVFGFVSSTVAYVFLLLLVLGVRSIPVLILTPTLLVGLIWVGMEHYLNLPLPTGLLL